jgi:hypothetical protein
MRKLLLLLILIIFAFTACKKDEVEELKILLEGIVTDFKTGQPLDNVKIKVQTDDKMLIDSTDENGYFKIGKLNPGEYLLVFTKQGYLAKFSSISSECCIVMTGAVEQTLNVSVTLAPLSEELIVTLYKRYLANEMMAAANFPYTIYLGSFNDPVTGTTDENGLLSQTGLPYSTYFTIDINHEENGVLYKGRYDISVPYGNEYMVVYGYYPEGDFGVASSNMTDQLGAPIDDFNIHDSIVVNFTQPADTTISAFALYRGGWLITDATLGWTNSNMTATINPVDSLVRDTEYELVIDAENEAGTQSYNDYLYFNTEE